MTQENMMELNTLLDQVEVPEPSDLLKARILQQARAQRPPAPAHKAAPLKPAAPKPAAPKPANDNHWKRWTGLAAMAVILGVVGFITLTPVQTSEEEVWANAAQNMGYGDLYAWVEGGTVEEDAMDVKVGDETSYPL